MNIIISQYKKGLYNAGFNIYSGDRVQTGEIRFTGATWPKLGSFEIYSIYSVPIFINPGSLIETKRNVIPVPRRKIRKSYKVIFQNMTEAYLFQEAVKKTWVKEMCSWVLEFSGCKYHYYHVGYGTEGIISPVYKGDARIAVIKKSPIAIDDLHEFYIEGAEPEDIPAHIIYACYMYVLIYYKPGRILKGTVNHYFKSLNPDMLAK